MTNDDITLCFIAGISCSVITFIMLLIENLASKYL
jgi:hypothetical protein